VLVLVLVLVLVPPGLTTTPAPPRQEAKYPLLTSIYRIAFEGAAPESMIQILGAADPARVSVP